MHERTPLYSNARAHSQIFPLKGVLFRIWVKTQESLLCSLTLGIPGDFRNTQKITIYFQYFLATWLSFGACPSPHFYQLSYGAWSNSELYN